MLVRQSTAEGAPATLRVAFASGDRKRVDQHFGAATAFVLYDVSREESRMAGMAEFPAEMLDGSENKLAARVDFLAGCDAVFVFAIGASAIEQLLARGVQPLRVGETDVIDTLLKGIGDAMRQGGTPWIERALAAKQKQKAGDRFALMEAEGWEE
ncbi:MAG: nitrogen fixation protein NifX [Azoarcus sp.]|jgi:nitrogen fixation protein NifX|nr:nitrogen fixation protein NifX [Azoarcus sp.]